MLKSLLAHPLTKELTPDNPLTTSLRRQIIREKSFLQQIYAEWYQTIVSSLPEGNEPVLEIGSGAGFLSEFLPGLITSEIFFCPEIKIVLDATRLPFSAASLRAIVMTDVLHHVPQPREFFVEAARCIRPGGAIVMIEPWVTNWSHVVYRNFHHEPFRPEANEWEFASTGPLSSANSAMPWMIFERDRAQFEQEFPVWRIHSINPIMPFRYLISGGVSLHNFAPGSSFTLFRRLEQLLRPWMKALAMFAEIKLVRAGEEIC